MGDKTKRQLLKEEDHEHLLMLEILDYQMRKNPQPQNLIGQFVLSYQLYPPNQLGVPVMAETMYKAFGKFAKSYGFEEYDKRKVFSVIKSWGIDSKRFIESGTDSKFYVVNPLHKLNDLIEDDDGEDK